MYFQKIESKLKLNAIMNFNLFLLQNIFHNFEYLWAWSRRGSESRGGGWSRGLKVMLHID